jgi:hypothetical protein
MGVLIEVLTLVMRRHTLEAAYPGGAAAMLHWLKRRPNRARWVVSDANLVAASFDGPDLRVVIEALMEQGFSFDASEGDPDAIIVDGIFGVAQPCAWFAWARPTSGRGRYSMGWLSGSEPGDLALPPGHTPGRDVPLRDYTRRDPAMVRLGVEGSTEVWLDTRTGDIEWQIGETRHAEPGPIMAGILEGFKQRPTRIQEPRLTEGDAEELTATLHVGDLPCTLQVHAFEGQGYVEAFLFLPIRVPRARLSAMEAAPIAVNSWMMDPVRSSPCAWFSSGVGGAPGARLGTRIVDFFMETGPKLMRGLTRIAESPDYAWLEHFMGPDEVRELTTGIPTALVYYLDALAVEVHETGYARLKVPDLLAAVGAQDLNPVWRERISRAMDWVGLDRTGITMSASDGRVTLVKRVHS